MNKKLLLSVLTIMTVAFTGCGASTTGNSSSVESSAPASTTEAGVEDTAVEEAGTVTIVHALGETEVAKNPKSVVVLDYGMLDGIDVLGGVEGLGLETVALPLSSTLPEYLSAYQDENAYANVGTLKEIDLEKIFEVEPDLIIIGGRQAGYYEELSKIAPTVQLSVDAADYMNSFKTNMTYLGQIFDKEAEVETKIAEMETAMNALGEIAKEKDVNGLIALANGDSFSVYGLGSRFGIIHNEFGIKPVDETIEASTHGQNASFEYIVEQNPDYLFIVDRSAATGGEGSAPAMFDNELIAQTDAYKNERIIYLDPVVWYTAGGGFTSTQVMIDEIAAALEK